MLALRHLTSIQLYTCGDTKSLAICMALEHRHVCGRHKNLGIIGLLMYLEPWQQINVEWEENRAGTKPGKTSVFREKMERCIWQKWENGRLEGMRKVRTWWCHRYSNRSVSWKKCCQKAKKDKNYEKSIRFGNKSSLVTLQKQALCSSEVKAWQQWTKWEGRPVETLLAWKVRGETEESFAL